MGRKDEIGQLKPVECSYALCMKRFDTLKEMKAHKVSDVEHFYCKKCDIDCDSWEQLTLHKAEAMVPWLEGTMRNNTGESPKHIVCEFCGEDFKSFGGRRLHREQRHQADQRITCPGCYTIFTRGGDLIAHFERNECDKISKQQYLGNVQQKHVVKEMMKDPHNLQLSLAANAASKDEAEQLCVASESSEADEGGVALLDQDDEQQKLGLEPLSAEIDLIDLCDKRLPLTADNLKRFPYLPGQGPSGVNTSTGGVSLPSSASDVQFAGPSEDTGSEMSAMEFASQITSRRGGKKVYTEPYPSLGAPSPASSTTAEEASDASSDMTVTPSSPAKRPTAWTTGATSQALFPNAKPSPSAGDWDAILAHRREEALADTSTNLFHSRWWDPSSKEYDAQRFYNHIIRRFCCPFEGCDDAVYDHITDLEGHFAYAHLRTQYTCPLCFKRFKSGSALIMHSEANGKCKVRKSRVYDRLLDEVSGGFLRAEYLREPKVAKGKEIEYGGGLMGTKLVGQMPKTG